MNWTISRYWRVVSAGLLLLWPVLDAGAGLRLEASRTPLSVKTVASGLSRPGGMACHPHTGEIYVAEENGDRISIIRTRETIPLLEGPFTISTDLPAWALSRNAEVITNAYLRKPCDIAFDAQGHLYVAENTAHGRLLRFEGLETGTPTGHVVITPWFNMSYAYTSVATDNTGQVFVTTRNAQGSVVTMGSVIMQGRDRRWRLVDFGPFADFANVAVNPDGIWLAVGEKRRGDISWYDTERELEISAADQLQGIRHIALQPDGTTLASLVRKDGTWSLMELHPVEGTMREIAGGLNDIGGICVNPATADIYISLAWKGEIMRLHRLQPYDDMDQDQMLHQMERRYEFEQILPPREWPSFFRQFVDRLDVIETVNPKLDYLPSSGTGHGTLPGTQGEGLDTSFKTYSSAGKQTRIGQRGYGDQEPMTMEEFAAAVPVVAGKVKTYLQSAPELEPDPIKEMSFVLLYPNQTMVTRQTAAPSISLMKASHQSGKEVRTRFMPNKNGVPLHDGMSEDDLPEVLVSFPSGFITPQSKQAEEGLVNVYFCGMGLGPDYWIDINRAYPEQSSLIVEKPNGDRIHYTVEPYREDHRAGGQSVLVGMGTPPKGGWYVFGNRPALWSVTDTPDGPLKTKHWVGLESDAAQNIRNQASYGEVYSGELTQEEINLRRKIVLRAATRWE
jgi:hypothetical protein